MKLPTAAAAAWRAHREALRRIARDESQPSRLLLTGGSVLAGEWEHRESIDIDMLLPERRSIDDLGPRRRLDLEAATGGTIIRQTRYRIIARTPEGVLDVTAMKPELEGCEREIEVEGATQTVLSAAQILRGKLARIKKALPRDAFDLITAAKAAPAALEIAVNALSPQQRRTAKSTPARLERGDRNQGWRDSRRSPKAVRNAVRDDGDRRRRSSPATRVHTGPDIQDQERHQRPDPGPSRNTPSDEHHRGREQGATRLGNRGVPRGEQHSVVIRGPEGAGSADRTSGRGTRTRYRRR